VQLLFALAATAPATAQDVLDFNAADSVRVTAHLYETSDRDTDGPVIVAFHQAGSNGRGEYGPIAERLLVAGYSLLAVDLRSGGDRFGFRNLTADRLGQSVEYCDVMPDLRAAVHEARRLRPGSPIVLWGSSYSAALVLRLAAEEPAGVVAVLAFSPASGGPMADCRGEDLSDRIQVPVLALRPVSEMENESVEAQAELFRSQGHEVFVSKPGTHGSSMLVPGRVGADVESTWRVVLAFLADADSD
jgi:dienelactone hydrolase